MEELGKRRRKLGKKVSCQHLQVVARKLEEQGVKMYYWYVVVKTIT